MNSMKWTSERITEMYNEALNEEGPILFGSIKYDRARVLEKIDIVAYREGLNNYADTIRRDIRDEEELTEFDTAWENI